MAGVVDRLLAQLPGLKGESPAYSTAPRQTMQFGTTIATPRAQSASARQLLGVWARVLLGLTLSIMMAGWPYLRSCGFPLAGYLGAIGTVILAGGWAAVAAWRHRVALAHLVSLIVVLYGIMLTAAELLPRTGYAVDRASWQCDQEGVLLIAPALTRMSPKTSASLSATALYPSGYSASPNWMPSI
jgi:hypothetical protein